MVNKCEFVNKFKWIPIHNTKYNTYRRGISIGLYFIFDRLMADEYEVINWANITE